jgi:hypothetical protein
VCVCVCVCVTKSNQRPTHLRGNHILIQGRHTCLRVCLYLTLEKENVCDLCLYEITYFARRYGARQYVKLVQRKLQIEKLRARARVCVCVCVWKRKESLRVLLHRKAVPRNISYKSNSKFSALIKRWHICSSPVYFARSCHWSYSSRQIWPGISTEKVFGFSLSAWRFKVAIPVR